MLTPLPNQPVSSSTRQSIIHHPTDALDVFGQYDRTSSAWSRFDQNLTDQILDFEAAHPQYRRPQATGSRRSAR